MGRGFRSDIRFKIWLFFCNKKRCCSYFEAFYEEIDNNGFLTAKICMFWWLSRKSIKYDCTGYLGREIKSNVWLELWPLFVIQNNISFCNSIGMFFWSLSSKSRKFNHTHYLDRESRSFSVSGYYTTNIIESSDMWW